MLQGETAGEERRPQTTAATQETTLVRVKKLGHVVFTVSDIERTTKCWRDFFSGICLGLPLLATR